MQRVYRLLIALYPARYRVWFAAEMANVLADVSAEQRRRGRAAFARFAIVETLGLLQGLAVEWTTNLRRTHCYCPMQHVDLKPGTLPDEIAKAENAIALLVSKMVQSIASHQFDKARFYSAAERKARANLQLLRQKVQH